MSKRTGSTASGGLATESQSKDPMSIIAPGSARADRLSSRRSVIDLRTAQLDLDHDVKAPRAARGFLAAVLENWAVAPDLAGRLQLLASELVSNAVLHGDGPIRMIVSEEDQATRVIRVEVSNTGEGRPVVRRANHTDLSGRGLQLVDELARAWGTRSDSGQTFVWFEVVQNDA